MYCFFVELSCCLSSLLFQNIVPLLKYVRGEALSPDHWLELFRLLKMPRGTILEKLTFGDVMESTDQIIAHADALKVRLNPVQNLSFNLTHEKASETVILYHLGGSFMQIKSNLNLESSVLFYAFMSVSYTTT